jgi:hypothetical protein
MAQINQALLELPCRHFLGILDCCFAGAFRWSSTRIKRQLFWPVRVNYFGRFLSSAKARCLAVC